MTVTYDKGKHNKDEHKDSEANDINNYKNRSGSQLPPLSRNDSDRGGSSSNVLHDNSEDGSLENFTTVATSHDEIPESNDQTD